MTQTDLALRTGLTKKTINQIIRGNAPITVETAFLLEIVLRRSANFWLNLETNYAAAIARKERNKRLKKYEGILKQFPIKELSKRGYISENNSKTVLLEEILRFFGVASFDQLFSIWNRINVNYRKSGAFESEEIHVFTWLKCGEKDADKIDCAPYNPSLFKEALKQIRKLTLLPFSSAQEKIIERCRTSGVAVVFTPKFSGCKVNGAAWWPKKQNKAVIQFSLRGKMSDIFWFTFYHECCHILNHGKKSIFRDNTYPNDNDNKYRFNERLELEADEFASNFLIPKKNLDEFIHSGSFKRKDIINFSKKQGIHPGIVVGQLQHRKVLSWQTSLNKLKDNSYGFDS